MSDRAWMYTGYTSQKVWTEEWLTKTKGFVKAAFANGQEFSWCPCAVATTIKRGTSLK